MSSVLYCWLLFVITGSRHCVRMVHEGEVASSALYLPPDRFTYGPHISATGGSSCVAVHRGYVYVTYYGGGMDDRRVRLARKKVGGSNSGWVNLEFPHRHVCDRADRGEPDALKRGDSHNWIAVGISPKDDTVHLLYDMHAYTPDDFPYSYFNYRVSRKGAAAATDAEFRNFDDVFPQPKRNFVNPDVPRDTYHRVTYPSFSTTPKGDLVMQWRKGGTWDATRYFHLYDGDVTGQGQQFRTPMWIWNDNGHGSGNDVVGFYGSISQSQYDGKAYACWSRRSEEDNQAGIEQNANLYFAHSEDPLDDPNGRWYNLRGEPSPFPIEDFDPFLIAEPAGPGDIMKGPWFAVTSLGSILVSYTVNDETTHLFRRWDYVDEGGGAGGGGANSAGFEVVAQGVDAPDGEMHPYGDSIYAVTLERQPDGFDRPVVWSTAQELIEWRRVYEVKGGPGFSHGVSRLDGRDLYFYGQQIKPREVDARPLQLLRFVLPPGNAAG